jgi:hypothetical protein
VGGRGGGKKIVALIVKKKFFARYETKASLPYSQVPHPLLFSILSQNNPVYAY